MLLFKRRGNIDMANLLMIVPDNFEDVEAIATLDTLKRGGHNVFLSSVMNRIEVKTKCGYILQTDDIIENVDISEFDGLIIPGGPGSFTILDKMPIVDKLIVDFYKNNKLVAAICTAPHLIGRLGLLKNKEFTVHPGFEDQVIGGTYLRESGVVRDGNFITAKSMYYSIEFGLKIHEYFHGTNSRERLEASLQGE